MPGKHDHREALRPRGWAGSAGGDAERLRGNPEKELGEGRKGGGEWRERPAYSATALGLDPVYTVGPGDVFPSKSSPLTQRKGPQDRHQ